MRAKKSIIDVETSTLHDDLADHPATTPPSHAERVAWRLHVLIAPTGEMCTRTTRKGTGVLQSSRLLAVLTLLACSPESRVKKESSQLAQIDTPVHQAVQAQQPSDSSITRVIGPEGDTVELAGFATVVFPAGAFDAPHEVTIVASNDPDLHSTFRLDVGAGSVGHQIRILTGDTPPAVPINVSLKVPEDFLEQMSPDKVPVIFALTRYVGPMHVHYEYDLRESHFNREERTTSTRLEPGYFAEHEEREKRGGMEAVLMIASAYADGSDDDR